MKTIAISLILSLLSATVHGQLKLKSIEKNNAFGKDIVINETTGAVLPSNLVPDSEMIIHTFDKFIYTRPVDKFKTEPEETLKKYQLANGVLRQIASFRFPTYALISFFNNGAFALMEGDEMPGKDVKIYTGEFSLTNTVTPFTNGVNGFHYDSSGDVIVVGANKFGERGSKIFAFDNTGSILFQTQLPDSNGEVLKVIASKNWFAVYSFDVNSKKHFLSMISATGVVLWTKSIDSMVHDWCFITSTDRLPNLLMGTRYSFFIYDTQNGVQIAKKDFSDIFREAGIKTLKANGEANILSVVPLTNHHGVSILLSEVVGYSGATNNVLYSFKGRFDNNNQTIRLDDTKGLLQVKRTATGLCIVNEKELIRYESVDKK